MILKRIENFTPSQDRGLDLLNEFRQIPVVKGDNNSRVFVLKGQAGTGKTTLIRYAYGDLIKEQTTSVDQDDDFLSGLLSGSQIVGIAMAHKAKQVLSNSIPKVYTFAKYFGLKIQYDQDGNISFVRPPNAPKENPCDIYTEFAVHDEVSMYDMDMVKIVLECTHPKTKIIFMGDPGQLPPVKSIGDMDSPAFELFKNVHTLTERVRQTDGNPIIALSDIIYDQIFGEKDLLPVYKAFKNNTLDANGKGFESVFYDEFLDRYASSSKHFMDSKTVAYTNPRVNDFNRLCRQRIHGDLELQYIPGEIIYMKDTFFHDKSDVNPPYMLTNSSEYIIERVHPHEIDGVAVSLLYLSKEGHPELEKIKDPFIPVVNYEGEERYNNVLFWRKKAALEAKSGWQRASKWSYYYKFENLFAKVSYAYCYTAYKAQGSTFKKIFMDVNNIVTVGPLSDKRKLQALYTGMTRASDNLYLLKTR